MDNELVKNFQYEVEPLENLITFMEVCGTYTMEIGKLGLRIFFKIK